MSCGNMLGHGYVCGHDRSLHRGRAGPCFVAHCECLEYRYTRPLWKMNKGHVVGMRGKIYSKSQLEKHGSTKPYGESL